MEERIIDGFPNYSITINGIVKNIRSLKVLKASIGNHGYLTVMCYNSKSDYKTFTIHRLIAKYFIPNPQQLPVINHKNGIKTDNRVENLEWCTQKHNMQHAFKTGLAKQKKGEYSHWFNKPQDLQPNSKLVFDPLTGIFYSSVKELALLIGVHEQTLRGRMNPKARGKTHYVFA